MFELAIVFLSKSCSSILSEEEKSELTSAGLLVTDSVEKALAELKRGKRIYRFTVTDETADDDATRFIQHGHEQCGFLGDFQVIVCDDPSSTLQGFAEDNGIRTFWAKTGFAECLRNWNETHGEWVSENELFVMAVTAYLAEDWSTLEKALPKLEVEAKSDHRLAHLLGLFLARSDAAKAEAMLETAKVLSPTSAPINSALAQAKLNSGKAEEAFAMFARIEKLNERNPERKALLAAAAADLGRWDEAARFVQDAAVLDPNNTKVHEINARLQFQNGNIDQAISVLQKVERIDEYMLSKLNEEGIKLSRSDQLDKALHLYRVCRDLAPTHLKYKLSYNIALANKRVSRWDAAIEAAQQALTEAPKPAQEKIRTLIDGLKKEKSTHGA